MILLHESWTTKFPQAGVSRRAAQPYLGRRDRDLPPAARPEADVDPGLLIAQVEHGPQLHGGIVPLIVVAVALVGGLAYLVYRGRKGPDRDPASGSDRGPEA
jgi:hypothetical protein